jgi:hypothetical protein
MIKIFMQRFGGVQDDGVYGDPQRYLKEYASDIELLGKLFQYLDLAAADNKSPLGWKPTDRLIDIIVDRTARVLHRASGRQVTGTAFCSLYCLMRSMAGIFTLLSTLPTEY